MNRLILIGLIVSCVAIVAILWLIRTRRLQERHALIWLVGAGVIVILGVSSSALEAVSRAVGIAYPPSALFLVVVSFLGVALLECVITISRLTDRVRTLAQRLAILDERLDALMNQDHSGSDPLDGDASSANRAVDEFRPAATHRDVGP